MSNYELHRGDCLEVLRTMPDNSIDAIVTDPPYGLSKEPDMAEVLKHWLAGDDYVHKGKGFMGKSWDSFVPGPAVWRECLRVLKPGGHLVSFFGTRTYDMGVLAIRLAGFEVRDQLAWVYGSGFPKSQNVSKAIDKMGGQPWAGFAAMLDKVIKDAGFNYTSLDRALGIPSAGLHSCYWVRMDERGGLPPRRYYEKLKVLLNPPTEFTDLYDKAEREVLAIEKRKNAPSGIVSAGRESVEIEREITAPATEAAQRWEGWGTALKPAQEPIVLARKPLIGTVAANVLEHGTGALNIDGCRVPTEEGGRPKREVAAMREDVEYGGNALAGRVDGSLQSSKAVGSTDQGRWPANLAHDGSDEVLAAFPDAPGQQRSVGPEHGEKPSVNVYGDYGARDTFNPRGDKGSAARFFYCAKASKRDRNEGCEHLQEGRYSHDGRQTPIDNAYQRNSSNSSNSHPTVKPTDLMRWLVRLVTPPGGIVLDPYTGSGSTGKAAILEGFDFVGIERDADESGESLGYIDIARARIEWAVAADAATGESPQADMFAGGVA